MRRTAVALAALLMVAGTSPVLAGGEVPKLTNFDAGPHLAELFNDSPSLVTGTNTLTIQIRDLTAEHVIVLVLEGPNGARVPVPLTRVIVVGDPEDDEHSHAEQGDDHAAAPADDHATPAVADVRQKASDPHGSSASAQTVARDGHGSPSAQSSARPAPPVDPHGAGQQVDAHGVAGSGHGDRRTDADHTSADTHDVEAVGAHGQATETETYLARGSVSLPTTGTWTARLVIRDQHGEEVVGETPLIAVEGGPSKLYLSFTGSLIFGSMLFGLIQRRRKETAPTRTEGQD